MSSPEQPEPAFVRLTPEEAQALDLESPEDERRKMLEKVFGKGVLGTLVYNPDLVGAVVTAEADGQGNEVEILSHFVSLDPNDPGTRLRTDKLQNAHLPQAYENAKLSGSNNIQENNEQAEPVPKVEFSEVLSKRLSTLDGAIDESIGKNEALMGNVDQILQSLNYGFNDLIQRGGPVETLLSGLDAQGDGVAKIISDITEALKPINKDTAPQDARDAISRLHKGLGYFGQQLGGITQDTKDVLNGISRVMGDRDAPPTISALGGRLHIVENNIHNIGSGLRQVRLAIRDVISSINAPKVGTQQVPKEEKVNV